MTSQFLITLDFFFQQSCSQSTIYFQQDFSCCEGRIFMLWEQENRYFSTLFKINRYSSSHSMKNLAGSKSCSVGRNFFSVKIMDLFGVFFGRKLASFDKMGTCMNNVALWSDRIGSFPFSPNSARSMACPRKASIRLGCWRRLEVPVSIFSAAAMFWRSMLRIDSSVSPLFLGCSFGLPETITAKCSQKWTQNFNFWLQNYRRLLQIFCEWKSDENVTENYLACARKSVPIVVTGSHWDTL